MTRRVKGVLIDQVMDGQGRERVKKYLNMKRIVREITLGSVTNEKRSDFSAISDRPDIPLA